MESGFLPKSVRDFLQFLANNKILSKSNPERMFHEVREDLVNIKFDAGRYVCLFLQMRPTRSTTPIPVDSFTTYFGRFENLYTPFLYPILNPEKDANYDRSAITPMYAYGKEYKVLEEVFIKGRYVLKKAGLSEDLLPKFLALTSSRIGRKDENGIEQRLEIEGQVKFTTVQVIKYLQLTTDVEEIIDMWNLGVLPEQYEAYKEYYSAVPAEWVQAVFEKNVKFHWEPKQ